MIQSTTAPRCISPVFLTRIPPAALQSPASQPQNTKPCQSSTLPRQLERGEAKSSENFDNAMHSRSCVPDDPHHHINITRHEHGVAWHGERAQHEKGHLHQQPSSEPSSQSGPVILDMEVASRTSPSKSDTAIILLFLFFFILRLIGLDTNTGP
jgi:hypothetical protein